MSSPRARPLAIRRRSVCDVEDSGVPPPRDVTVTIESTPLLFLADGTPLVRAIGFRPATRAHDDTRKKDR
jgi:hypothetical protein